MMRWIWGGGSQSARDKLTTTVCCFVSIICIIFSAYAKFVVSKYLTGQHLTLWLMVILLHVLKCRRCCYEQSHEAEVLPTGSEASPSVLEALKELYILIAIYCYICTFVMGYSFIICYCTLHFLSLTQVEHLAIHFLKYFRRDRELSLMCKNESYIFERLVYGFSIPEVDYYYTAIFFSHLCLSYVRSANHHEKLHKFLTRTRTNWY